MQDLLQGFGVNSLTLAVGRLRGRAGRLVKLGLQRPRHLLLRKLKVDAFRFLPRSLRQAADYTPRMRFQREGGGKVRPIALA